MARTVLPLPAVPETRVVRFCGSPPLAITSKLAMPVGSRIFVRERYYQVLKPKVSKVYAGDDALFLSIKNQHDGPWDESEQLEK